MTVDELRNKFFFDIAKKYLPTATRAEYYDPDKTLMVFFKTRKNEFGIDETKVVRMLKIYTLMGGDKFDAFLEECEMMYKTLSIEGDAMGLDIKFMFV